MPSSRVFALTFLTACGWLPGQEPAAPAGGQDAAKQREAELDAAVERYFEKQSSVESSYGSKGFRFGTRDGNFQTNLQWRAQLRFTDPYRSDPRQVDDFEATDESTFEARRLRMKIGGHGYRPWLKYYFEVDLQPTRSSSSSSSNASARVIDWRIDVAKWKEFGIRAGQWKIDYNRERVDSSGRQQFVERSIVNRTFTIDRQMGVSFRGRLFEGTPADLRYYAGVFTGEGRGVANDDRHLMYVTRLQWNFLGRDLPLRQTDVERTEEPTGSFALGAATHRGRPTRWSSSGGGNLDGFDSVAVAANGQHRINQAVAEFAFKHQGFSTQNEFHWKSITDKSLPFGDRETDLYGLYTQFGYFFNEVFDSVPEELELAARYAWVKEPNEIIRRSDNERQEFTIAANWFFAGHNNKLTLDYSYLTLDDDRLDTDESASRVRLQWDISF
ncbi:MAG: porin [Planctomycetota bacterium]